MTDKELLELAAKAAGYTHIPSVEIACGVRTQGWFIKETDAEPIKEERWNPITDDGDALRLMVQLKLYIDWSLNDNMVYVTGCTEQLDDDPYAATRRAIVRAAAEIGKGMK
jgi:hypothetical protein